MASSSARASRASCFFCAGEREQHPRPAGAAGGPVQAALDLARQRAQVRALERGPGPLVAAQRGDQRGLLGGARVRVDANPGAALDRLPRLLGGGDDTPGRPAANPRQPPQTVRSGREDRADRLQTRVDERRERHLAAGQVPEPVDRQHVKRVGHEPVAHRLVRPAGDLAASPGAARTASIASWTARPSATTARAAFPGRSGPASAGSPSAVAGSVAVFSSASCATVVRVSVFELAIGRITRSRISPTRPGISRYFEEARYP